MEAIILAAGLGRRLRPLTDDRPKSLLPVAGVPLLEHQVRAVRRAGITGPVIVVTGHAAQHIDRRIDILDDPRIVAAHNPSYGSAGPILSLATGLQESDGDVLVMNGDTYYSTSLLHRIAEQARGGGVWLAVSRVAELRHDDMRVRLRPDGRLAEVAKDIPADRCHGASAGLLAAHGSGRAALDSAVNQAGEPLPGGVSADGPWHAVVNALATAPPGVRTVEVPVDCWQEVDRGSDIPALERIVRREVRVGEREN